MVKAMLLLAVFVVLLATSPSTDEKPQHVAQLPNATARILILHSLSEVMQNTSTIDAEQFDLANFAIALFWGCWLGMFVWVDAVFEFPPSVILLTTITWSGLLFFAFRPLLKGHNPFSVYVGMLFSSRI
jgi:hypothetical protein